MESERTSKEKLNKNYTFELSDKEQKYFKKLDEMGDVGVDLLYYINNFLENKENDLEVGIEVEDIETSNLTNQQLKLLDNIIEKYNFDAREFSEYIENNDDSIILKAAENLIKTRLSTASSDVNFIRDFNDGKIDYRFLPNCLVIYLNDSDYYKKLHPSSWAFHLKRKDDYVESPLEGKIVVVDKNNNYWRDHLKHEYFHLINDNYIEPNQIDQPEPQTPQIDRKTSELLEKKQQLIKKMNEEGWDDEVKQRIDKINKKIVEKVEDKYKDSPYYRSQQAEELFLRMKDELVAHLVGGVIEFEDSKIVPENFKSFNDALKSVPSSNDIRKLNDGWESVKKLLQKCKEKKAIKKRILSVILSSQSFDNMEKRLKIFLSQL